MLARLGVLATLVVLYVVGQSLAAAHAANPDAAAITWTMAGLMVVTFLALVALMYTKVLPALLALPILAVALASIAGMKWDVLFTKVIADGTTRLSGAIIAAILGAILAQVVEKTGIAQTAIKKTAELGGDRPIILAVLLTLVIALLFTTLGGLGAVIMVATIAIPILLSLGLRPVYVGCLFLLALSLGGVFNLANWQLYKDVLGLDNAAIGRFAYPFAGAMLLATAAFMVIEGKRLGKSRFKAAVNEVEGAPQHTFVPWYALLTPVIPLLPVLFFALLPKVIAKPAEITISAPRFVAEDFRHPVVTIQPVDRENGQIGFYSAGAQITLPAGRYEAAHSLHMTASSILKDHVQFDVKPWTKISIEVTTDPETHKATINIVSTSTTYDFPIAVALLLGILYGAITTWKRGQSTVQLLTKSSFDGVAAVGPAVVLMIGIGMVLLSTMSAEVSGIIGPAVGKVLPQNQTAGAFVHYVLLFGILAPLALYRGPLNTWGMGAGLLGLMKVIMPPGAIMGAFMSVGMVQGVCDPTNTHNVWIANYTNTDMQEILKRTLPYMWVLAFVGLLIAGAMFYLVK
ncbi:MAG: hypothetical protein BWY76_00886 [bacterium ADurb.Bin429]|nr:MAG: hypothetical protein BWY76_00886 [bacterium ADurb.Bin429]